MPDKPSAHYMQTATWATIKAKYGWKSDILEFNSTDIIAYKRMVPGVGKLIYIPGLGSYDPETLTESLRNKYKNKSFCVRIEPDELFDEQLLSAYQQAGWRIASRHVQYRHTILIDLSVPLDEVWMSFKSRGRYEVLQAQKAGVVVTDTEPTNVNLEKMYELMQITSTRNKFFIRDKQFSMDYWKKFRDLNQLKLFFAYHDGELLAGSIILTNGNKAWNKDGGSTRTKANLMAPRIVQWEAMKTLKKEGIIQYDLGGIPDPAHHVGSSIPGIYVFKSGFSKQTHALMPTMELPLSKRYKVWPKAEKQWLRVYNLFARNLWW